MIDHVSVAVSDLARSIEFYDVVFRPLGITRLWTASDAAGYGYNDVEEPFAIKLSNNPEPLRNDAKIHIAFTAKTREAVTAFHAGALERGGIDEGPPDLHGEYGPGYFAAFVRDPDGNRLEAVLHERVGP